MCHEAFTRLESIERGIVQNSNFSNSIPNIPILDVTRKHILKPTIEPRTVDTNMGLDFIDEESNQFGELALDIFFSKLTIG